MSPTAGGATRRDVEPLAALTHGIDSAWHSFGGWLDDFARIQQEGLRFMHRRLERDLDAAAHVIACRDPAEILDLQLWYGSEFLADSVALVLKLVALVNGGARRRYRRAAARRQGKPASA